MQDDELTIGIEAVEKWQPPEGQPGTGIVLQTTRGPVHAIGHQEAVTDRAVIWVWGAKGGVDGPADGIYGALAEDLKSQVASLRVDYRHPGVLRECVLDTLVAASFLAGLGYARLALVGHSFGGAVVISAGSLSPLVRAVVALSSQTYGAQGVAELAPRPLLLVHGLADRRLGPHCSETVHQWAREPKELVMFPGAGHNLRECRDQLFALLRSWLMAKLA